MSTASLPAAASPILAVSRLCAWYGRAQILFDIDLTLARGEVVALMGRNGAGKSTTLKAIMGLLDRVQGSIRLEGADIRGKPAWHIARAGLGYVPEDRRIFTELTVMENLAVGRQARRSDAPLWTVDKVFELFPNLGRMRNRRGGEMSGGEQQMLTVARTLMGNPRVILLDEPSEGVAPLIVEQMAAMILDLKHEGLSVLLSEQNPAFAGAVSDRACILEKGQVQFDGSMRSLIDSPEIGRAFLGL